MRKKRKRTAPKLLKLCFRIITKCNALAQRQIHTKRSNWAQTWKQSERNKTKDKNENKQSNKETESIKETDKEKKEKSSKTIKIDSLVASRMRQRSVKFKPNAPIEHKHETRRQTRKQKQNKKETTVGKRANWDKIKGEIDCKRTIKSTARSWEKAEQQKAEHIDMHRASLANKSRESPQTAR